jgi:antitoxin (DNA-binding transcriptional repressor) of toxin-antitoxin stability system
MDVLRAQLELALLRVSEESRFQSVVRAEGGVQFGIASERMHRQSTSFRERLLIGINRCDTMSHMKTITIRELHLATGRWVRRAAAGEVYVTERGRLVAKIVPASPLPAKPFFADPKFTPAFLANRKHLRGGTDSTQAISDERNREVL